MFFRKQNPPSSWTDKEKVYNNKSSHKEQPNFLSLTNPHLTYTLFLSVFLFAWFLVLVFWFPPNPNLNNHNNHNFNNVGHCDIANFSVYVYDMPAEFNVGLLEDCRHLNIYTDMCPHVANRGLGQPISVMGLPAAEPTAMPSWFATHQFIAEMIFHARVENHPCRTRDPRRASLFYVPFYGGLHASSKFREPNLTARDVLAVRLADFLESQPFWERNQGKDHFIALGRTAWDFMRSDNGPDFGANCLLNLPAVMNMSVMTVERNPWNGANQHGIPYPSYFHPSTWQQMSTWQDEVKRASRPNLFSFIGGPRKGLEKAAIREELIKQCAGSDRCELLQCEPGQYKCHEPVEVLRVMRRSEFCLQAPGDSFTRRSTFDSVLAGCVPVFFSRHTAYTQYKWFLPEDAREYSVYIDEKSEESGRIEEVLGRIPRERVERMREKVVELIPTLTYAHPNATAADLGFHDAVDVALASLADHVRRNLVS